MKDPLEEAQSTSIGAARRFVLIAVVLGLVGLAIVRPGAATRWRSSSGSSLMVMLHEAGHFIAARRAGMKATSSSSGSVRGCGRSAGARPSTA